MAGIGHDQCSEDERIVCGKRVVISKLPRETGCWYGNHLIQYQGCWYEPGELGLEGVLHAQQHFKAKPSDIVLSCVPKSGTTWLKALVFAIMNRNNNSKDGHNLLNSSPHECVPFLELPQDDDHHRLLFDEHDDRDDNIQPRDRILATHMPFTSLPASVLSSGCKVVYICRDPKDVLVSLWHFVSRIRTQHLKLQPISLGEAYELFSRGVSPYGPYWDHVLGYWKASLEHPDKVLFLKYEDVKREPLEYVIKLARFLDRPFTLEEEAKGIVDLCSFETLSNLQVNKDGAYLESGIMKKNDLFFRQGEVGDWRNHLTSEMVAQLDQITRDKLDGSGLTLIKSPHICDNLIC